MVLGDIVPIWHNKLLSVLLTTEFKIGKFSRIVTIQQYDNFTEIEEEFLQDEVVKITSNKEFVEVQIKVDK